jgi:hypothetical protein
VASGSARPRRVSHAGLAYLPPQVRHAADALDAATSRKVPRLVQREDIAATCMHTTSDGATR